MADETEYELPDDTDEFEETSSPSLVSRVAVSFVGLALSIAAGYCIGWIIATVYGKLHE